MNASLLLLFTLLTAGLKTSRACGKPEHNHDLFQHSHLCYECSGVGYYCPKKPVMCPSGFSKCMSSTVVLEIDGSSLKMPKKECVDDCQNGSINYGVMKTAFTCCDTNFCNARDAPDPRFMAPNGRKCYYCDGQSCRNTVSCAGTEDSCITATLTKSGTSMLLKGCITKSICGLLKCSFIQDVSCCEGNLCNGDKGLTPYNADKSRNLSVIQSFTYGSVKSVTQIPYEGAKKSDTYRAMNEGAKKSDTYRATNEGAKSDTYRAMNEGAKKSDSYRAMNEGAKSDTQRSPYNGAKSVTHSFLFSALLLHAALILQ